MKSLPAYLLALAMTGCFVVPKTTTSTQSVGLETSSARYGAVRGLELSTSSRRGVIAIHAVRNRECLRDVYRVTEITERKRLGLGGTDDPRGRVFGALLAPVTLPVSLIVSGIAVAADRDSTHRERTVDHVEKSACTQPAENLLVSVQLPSGAHFEQHTGPAGTITFVIPETEPDQGAFIARAGTQTIEKKYKRRGRAEIAVRDAVTSCAERHGITGDLDVRIVVNEEGLPTKVDLDRGNAPLTTCVTTQVAGLLFPERDRGTTVVMRLGL